MIEALRKRKLDGELYSRDPKIEAQLMELYKLGRTELLSRCSVSQSDAAEYVPSECLLHLVRLHRGTEGDQHFEQLYRLLAARVLRRLPNPNDRNGKTVDRTREAIRDAAFDRFAEMLALDHAGYDERLDYYEVRFDGAVASLRKDAQDKVRRQQRREVPLESEITGTPTAEVEEAALEQAGGEGNPFDLAALDDARFRYRLDAAIDDLPPNHRRVVQLLRQGMPIDSKDPSMLTIARVLGCTGRTIQTYRDKAIAALRAALSPDAP